MRRFLFCCTLLAIIASDSAAQTPGDSASVPGSSFKTNKSRHFWMGANYRKEWNTPVKAPVLNMATEKGGLTVVKRGGGKQTRSLRLADPTGKEYNLRSIRKFVTSETLPMDLQSEAAEDLVADGISASYPYSALSMPALAEAVGVPYLKSKIVYIPDDPRLGEHREDFANMLAYLEEKVPDSVKKGYDTEEDILKKLREDNDNTVDQRALLRARILDMFVMDFDRHEGQWEWGAIDKGNAKHYYPIPKDRDQAFYINEGVLPHIIQWPWLVPQLEGLKPGTRSINRFNFAARNLDRFFLNRLTEKDWQDEVDGFIPKLTDAVIEKALESQPPEVRNISKDRIVNILKERRKHLAGEVMHYYRFLAETVTVTASDEPEWFEMTRNDDGSVLLKIYKLSDPNTATGVIYERLFDPRVTEELRLYGLGGNDKFTVTGKDDKIKIRLIGGEGNDRFENNTSSGTGTWVYDTKDEDNTLTGRLKNKISRDTLITGFKFKNYEYNKVIPFLSAGFNPDDGVFLGGWFKIVRHGFGKAPYKNSHTITMNGAFATGAFNFIYNADFIGVFGRKSDLVFETDIHVPEITNFFGYGVNTAYDKGRPGRFRYYRARYRKGDISLLLRKNFSEKVIMTLGPTFQFYKMDSTDKFNRRRNVVLQKEDLGFDPATAFSNQSYAGGRFSLVADTRNNKVLPRSGILWNTTVQYLSGLSDTKYEVTRLNSDFTFHINLINKVVTIANRFGGGHNFGDFEFYQAQYLGSDDNLRGYRKYRFAGRSKVYNNAEMRIVLAKFKTYLFPGALGIFGFYDTGRLWADDEDVPGSNDWVSGYGGGFWISPLRRMVFTITLATSKEDFIPMVGLGWKF
jgi:hypothetical protein